MPSKEKVRIVIIYMMKCVIGILCAHFVTTFLQLEDSTNWCLLSVLLVLAPDSEDSYKLAVTRIKANLVAAGAGLLLSPFYSPGILWISIGVIFAILLCYLFGVDAGARSASVAVIIILMHDEQHRWWEAATSRASAVLLGCVIGLIITFVFHYPEKMRKKKLAREVVDETKKINEISKSSE